MATKREYTPQEIEDKIQEIVSRPAPMKYTEELDLSLRQRAIIELDQEHAPKRAKRSAPMALRSSSGGYYYTNLIVTSAHYNWFYYNVSYWTSSPAVYNNYGVSKKVEYGGRTIRDVGTQYASNSWLNSEHNGEWAHFVAGGAYPNMGTRFSGEVFSYTFSWDNDSRWSASSDRRSVFGKTAPTMSANNFTFNESKSSATTQCMEFKDIKSPNGERVYVYQISPQGWVQATHTSATTGYYILTGFTPNTQWGIKRPMISFASSPEIDNWRVNVPAYPAYSDLRVGTINASKQGNNIYVAWSPWGNFGNILNTYKWDMNIEVINLNTDEVITRVPIDVLTSGSDYIPFPTGINVGVRIRANGAYFDGKQHETSTATIKLGYFMNVYVKDLGKWELAKQVWVKDKTKGWQMNDTGMKEKYLGKWQ